MRRVPVAFSIAPFVLAAGRGARGDTSTGTTLANSVYDQFYFVSLAKRSAARSLAQIGESRTGPPVATPCGFALT
jgi:hypothetical protein